MIPSPLKDANRKIAELTILLNAMFILLAESDKADEAFAKFGHLGMEINKHAKNPTAYSPLETGTDT